LPYTLLVTAGEEERPPRHGVTSRQLADAAHFAEREERGLHFFWGPMERERVSVLSGPREKRKSFIRERVRKTAEERALAPLLYCTSRPQDEAQMKEMKKGGKRGK
jgi:hypothetical protein